METTVLVLDAAYQPLKVVPWQRAIELIVSQKANLVQEYAGRVVRSAKLTLPLPAVVVLRRYVRLRNRVKFNRRNVLARDAHRCGYCGTRPLRRDGKVDLAELTIDHVVPRAQARDGRVRLPGGREVPVTCWENVATACIPCNMKKADRRPDQVGMTLRLTPRKPNELDILRMALSRVQVPEEWKDYLPKDSSWVDYWDVQLDAD
jgi:5-methylcytosine-specific restriction endonuclease McrA